VADAVSRAETEAKRRHEQKKEEFSDDEG